jgi:hypothetical protein
MSNASSSFRRENLIFTAFLLFGFPLILASALVLDSGYLPYTVGLTLMMVSLYIVIRVLGKDWIGSLGVLHMLMLILYHGGGTVLYGLFGEGHQYYEHAGVDSLDLANATLISGAGVLAFALGYVTPFLTKHRSKVWVLGKHPDVNSSRNSLMQNAAPIVFFLWMILVIAHTVGVFKQFESNALIEYVLSALFDYLALPVMVLLNLSLFSLVDKRKLPMRVALAIIVLYPIIWMLFGGERQVIIILAPVFVFLSFKWNIGTLKVSHLILGIVGLVALVFLMAVIRAEVGRAALRETTFAERVAVYEGLRTQDISNWTEAITRDLGYRLGANVFIATVNNSKVDVNNTLTVGQYVVPLNLMIPSALNTDKYSLPVYMRTVKGYIHTHFGMPGIDYLLTDVGLFYATGGTQFLVLAMAFLGLGVARLDVWLTNSSSRLSGLVGVCAAIALAWVEHDITIWFLSLRNILILYIMLSVLTILSNAFRRHSFVNKLR